MQIFPGSWYAQALAYTPSDRLLALVTIKGRSLPRWLELWGTVHGEAVLTVGVNFSAGRNAKVCTYCHIQFPRH